MVNDQNSVAYFENFEYVGFRYLHTIRDWFSLYESFVVEEKVNTSTMIKSVGMTGSLEFIYN